jgi:hypothetical protein
MRAADWLWANPVLRREWARGRPETRRRAVGSWLGLSVVLTTYAAAAWLLSREERSPWEARAFLLALCLLYLLWVNVVAPGPAALRISGEREARTWQALLLTALRPSQVVSAKLLVSMWAPALALGRFLPLLVMGAHAARLPAHRLAILLLVLMGAAAAAVSMALWLSGRCRHSRVAVALAYLLTTFFFWGAAAGSPSPLGHWQNLWWYLSPVWEVAVLCLAEPRLLPSARPLLPEWAWFLLACGVTTGLAVTLLIRRVAASDEG